MSIRSNLLKAAGLGAAITVFSVGASLAAVADASANVRSGPGTGYHVVNHVWPGEFVRVTSRSNGWCKVSLPGPDGWVICSAIAGSGFDRFDRFDRGPDFSFGFGFGGSGIHFHSHPRHPWWW